jgi:hypothetical protein
MSPSDLVLEVARRHVDDYVTFTAAKPRADESAAEVADCEAFLQSAVDSLKWLRSAEQFVLEAGRQGITPVGRQTAQDIRDQYEAWLRPGVIAEQWIARLSLSGREPANLIAFRVAHRLVSSVVASNAILQAIDAPLIDELVELPPSLPAGSGHVKIPLRRLETIVTER